MSTLKVGTIQYHANSNTAISIDTSGRILTPARPAFRVAKTDSDQSVTSGTSSQVTFNNEVFDIGNNFASNKFVVPVTGIYHFDAAVRVGPDSNNASFYNAQVFLKKTTGGSSGLHVMLQQISTYANGLSGGEAHMSVCNLHGGVTTSLVANDEITVWVTLQGTSPEVKSGAASDYTYFSGFLIG